MLLYFILLACLLINILPNGSEWEICHNGNMLAILRVPDIQVSQTPFAPCPSTRLQLLMNTVVAFSNLQSKISWNSCYEILIKNPCSFHFAQALRPKIHKTKSKPSFVMTHPINAPFSSSNRFIIAHYGPSVAPSTSSTHTNNSFSYFPLHSHVPENKNEENKQKSISSPSQMYHDYITSGAFFTKIQA